jgi:hypothetical protein
MTGSQPVTGRPPKPYLDPARHLLSHTRLEETASGSRQFRPISLDEEAWDARQLVEAGLDAEAGRRPARGVVVISVNRALAVSRLVEELSLRLAPGLAVGPIESNGSLSQLAEELSRDLYRRSY